MKITFIGSGDACATGGRNQTCILVEDPGFNRTFLVDCGPATLAALKKNNFDTGAIDFIINTHMHGDHFGGIPFFLLDSWININRKRDLTIFGPAGIEKRVKELQELLFPGLTIERMSYRVNFSELSADAAQKADIYKVDTFLMEHSAYSDCMGYKISNGAKTFSYTGDTAWTDKIFALADNTDLFISECSFFSKNTKISHVSYEELQQNLGGINTRRLILTHLSSEMFEHFDEIQLETAYDNLVIEL